MLMLRILILASVVQTAIAQPVIPDTIDLEVVRALPVQHDGRWMPLDTVARDLVESVTGEIRWEGHDPVAVLLAWTFDSGTWMNQPLISIANAELRSELKLPADQTIFSFHGLLRHEPLLQLMRSDAAMKEGRKPDPLESKVSDIEHRLTLLDSVLSGQAICLIPHQTDPLGAWTPIELAADDKDKAAADDPATKAWAALGRAFLKNDAPAFASAAGGLRDILAGLPAAHRPSADSIAVELRYNHLNLLGWSWKVMLVGAAFGLLALLARTRLIAIVTIVALVTGFAILTYDMSLRWDIAGRIPASNMFESLLFMGWGTGFFAILWMLFVRDRVVPLTASVVSALSLMLADCLPIDHFIRPPAPVLMDTAWMAIHVPVIMVSYAVLTLAFAIAHGQLTVLAIAPNRSDIIKAIDRLHYRFVLAGSFLLTIGIITGSMWAASSWGRYWGWDPKEVWSLIALLAYLTILHVRVDRDRLPPWMYALALLLGVAVFGMVAVKLAPLSGLQRLALAAAAVAVVIFATTKGTLATAFKSILGFWLIIMTYVGVNYVLGIGLHSYGFGTGAVVHYLFLVGSIDLAFVAICGVFHWIRTDQSSAPRLRPAT
jgi:ABC-type transport system involved in cytochrome c biogenesis permease subunit